MSSRLINPASLLSLMIVFVFGVLWIGFTALLRVRHKKDFVYLLFFTIFFVYIYNVLSHTLFQFQSLIILKYFVPDLILNGQADGKCINLIPLISLTEADLKTSLLNILLMMPFGFGLPFLARVRLGRVTFLAGIFSILIEFLQLTSGLLANITFRIADINDVLFNTLGGLSGYLIFLLFIRLVHIVFQNTAEPKNPILRYVLHIR
jgi:glycopeptide antibiotics resistance protein